MTRSPRPVAPHSAATQSRRWTARLASACLVLASFGVPLGSAPVPAAADTSPPDPTLPATVSTDPLPTAQHNGVVWSQVVIGDIVYAGGEFTRARPANAAPGTQEVVRTHLLAYNINTGVLTSFAPTLNGKVKDLAASPDGATLYVGGQFTTVNGVSRFRIAAFNTSTGALTSFAPSVGGTVNGLAVSNTTVFIGGAFSQINGVGRIAVGAVARSNGATTAFNPILPGGRDVQKLVVSPDGAKVVIGGNFETVNGSSNPGYGLALLESATGGSLPMPVNSLIRNARENAAILALEAVNDGFYGAGYTFGRQHGNLEGAFKADWNGNLIWVQDCHGDTYSVYPAPDDVYVAGHPHYCGNVAGFPQTSPTWTFQRGIAFTDDVRGVISRDPLGYFNFEGRPRPQLLAWFPDINAGSYTGQTQGPWSISGNNNYIVYGGEFTQVNGRNQQGLVRFARPNLAPHDDGPRLSGANYTPTATSFAQGIRINWLSNHDRDNERLTYSVIKNGNTGNPIFATNRLSTFWQRPYAGYLDTAVTPGQSYTYRIRVTDPRGNQVDSATINATASGGPSLSAYDQTALADGPESYWGFNETSGSTAADWASRVGANRGSGVTMNVPGAISGHPGTAYRFNGTSSGTVVNSGPGRYAPQIFSIELWFRTTTQLGGKLIGFGNAASGSSTQYDRHIYMSNTGRLTFGVNNAVQRTISPTTTYRDGQWHHVVGTLSPQGLYLYVDGNLVASRTDAVYAQIIYSGFWRIGGDNMSNWGGVGTSAYFNGDIDNVAIYHHPLTAAQVAAHYAARTGSVPNVPPTAAFTSTTNNLSASFNASNSSDPNGTIVSYDWEFGDGASGSGVTTSHTYPAAGTYPVTLTVTDDDGDTDEITQNVTVSAAANDPPTAAFTFSTNGLTASVNGTGSTDSDGTIVSHAWNFGDGDTGTGATTSHTYDAGGTYPVTLRVTDNDGSTDDVTQNVTVSDPNPGAPFVSDAFNRTLATGLGTADVGGAWTVSDPNGFSVGSGSGQWRLTAAGGPQRSAFVGSTLRDSTDLTVNFSSDKNATGGTIYAWVEGRRVSSNTEYRSVLRYSTSGSLWVGLEALKGSTSATTLAAEVNVGSPAPGTVVHVRMQTFGTNPTTVRTKVWLGAASEPAAWTVSATDTFAQLQVPGAVGMIGYLSGSATNAPVTFSVLDLTARPVP